VIKSLKKLPFSLVVLVSAVLLCIGISAFMDYPPLFILAASIIIISYWYVATVDFFREKDSFSGSPLRVVWGVIQGFLVFLSAGAAYTLIDTDWFLESTGFSGDIPYYVGCFLIAAQTRESVRIEVNSIAKGNLLSAQNFIKNVARVFAVIVIPWIVLLLSLWITAINSWHPLAAWIVSILLAFGAYSATSYALFYEGKRKIDRGVEEGTHEEAGKKLSRLRKDNETGINWGGTLLPFAAATGHFLAVGTTGSGKTVTIKLLLNSIVKSVGIKGSDHRAVLFDAKRELYAYFVKLGIEPGLIHTLDPFDKRGARWDIAGDIKTPNQAKQLAAALVVPPETKGDNAFFGDAARRILAGVIDALNYLSEKQEAQGKPPIDWRIRDLVLALRYEEIITHLLKKCPDTHYLIQKYFSNERELKAILSTLDTAISDFNGVAALWEHAPYSISLKKWANDPTGSIILLGYDKEQSEALDPLNRVIFRRLSDILVNQTNSDQRRTWVFLDELRLISRGLPGLFELINMGREKGACCVLGVIDIKGLMTALGENTAEEITGLCDNVAGLRTRSAPTAKWLAEVFGNAEVREETTSVDAKGEKSTSEHINERKTFLSGEFQKIEKPTELNGFTIGGYYLNGYTKPYFFNNVGVNGWQKIVPRLSNEEIIRDGVQPRPDSQQKLKLWDEADLNRLGIPDFDLTKIYGDLDEEEDEEFSTSNFRLADEEENIH
jgi:type IV secretory pathway TraG/TraD family ATPase VirD4